MKIFGVDIFLILMLLAFLAIIILYIPTIYYKIRYWLDGKRLEKIDKQIKKSLDDSRKAIIDRVENGPNIHVN